MADGQEFGASAALSVRVDEGSLRQARREIEQEIGDVQVGVDSGGGGTFSGSTLADGGGGALGASGGGLQRQQLGVLKDIHDELEQIGASGGFGAGGGAGGGLLSRVGGGRGGVGGGLLGGLLAGGPFGLAAALGLGGAAAMNPDRAADVASDPGQIFRPGQVGAALGTVFRGTLPGLLAGAVTDTSGGRGPEDSTQSTTEQGTPPQTVSPEDLIGVNQGDLRLPDTGGDGGGGVNPAQLADVFDGVATGFDSTVAAFSGASSEFVSAVSQLSGVSESFLTAGGRFSAAAATLEDFPTSISVELPGRVETADGETLPRSPVDRSEGEPGARGGGRPPGRGRLAPGPNAGGTQDVSPGEQTGSALARNIRDAQDTDGSDGQQARRQADTGERTNRAAERRRGRSQQVTVNNDVTVESGSAITERELQRELDRFERRLRRNLGGR